MAASRGVMKMKNAKAKKWRQTSAQLKIGRRKQLIEEIGMAVSALA